jgi:hypothetical protein
MVRKGAVRITKCDENDGIWTNGRIVVLLQSEGFLNIMSSTKSNGLSVAPYVGDGAVLLAFHLDEDKASRLAGFAIECIAPAMRPFSTNEYFVPNRLNFEDGLTSNKQACPASNRDRWSLCDSNLSSQQSRNAVKSDY